MLIGDDIPIIGVGVAEGAFAGVMALCDFLTVAALAFCDTKVVVVDQIPGGHVSVADGTVAHVVMGWRVLIVAGGALVRPEVVVTGDGPVGSICVAENTVAGVMVGGSLRVADKLQRVSGAERYVVGVAGTAFHHALVVELVGPPGAGFMAVGAVAREVLGVGGPEIVGTGGKKMDGENGRFPRMATGTDGRCPGVLAIMMAVFAGNISVTAGQRESAMIHCFVEKRNQGGLNQTRQSRQW